MSHRLLSRRRSIAYPPPDGRFVAMLAQVGLQLVLAAAAGPPSFTPTHPVTALAGETHRTPEAAAPADAADAPPSRQPAAAPPAAASSPKAQRTPHAGAPTARTPPTVAPRLEPPVSGGGPGA